MDSRGLVRRALARLRALRGAGKPAKKLGHIDRVFRSRQNVARIPVQDGVVLEVCWKERDIGRGPAASLYVHGDEVLRFDCFGPGRGHFHAELAQPERAAGRLYLPEVTIEAQVERALFEVTRNLDYYLQRNPVARVRHTRVDPAALEKACAEARARMLESLARAPSIRERIQSAARHTGGGFEAHLAGTESLLREWGCRLELQRAGRFHAVYGNPAGREAIASADARELVAEIGEEAERLVSLWSVVDRDSLVAAAASHSSGAPVGLKLAAGGETTVSAREYLELAHLHAANALEIAERNGKSCRKLDPLRPLLCTEAVARLDRAAARVSH